MSNTILDVSESSVMIQVKEMEKLVINLPIKCNEDECQAKYKKKQHLLKIILKKKTIY